MAELDVLISTLRKETEDLVSVLQNRFYFNQGTPYTDEGTVCSETGTPYTNEAQVLATIPVGMRYAYLTVNISGVEWWFLPNGLLANKTESLSLVDKSVTLAKMSDMNTASIIGRVSAGVGTPEILTIAQLLTMLELTDISTTVANKVDKLNGYSLVLNTEIAKIHELGSDDQDLSAITAAITALNAAVRQNAFYFILPTAGTVAERLLGIIVYGPGTELWTFAADGIDLLVTHNTGRNVAAMSVSQKGTDGIRPLLNGAGYVGYLAGNTSVLRIEAFAKDKLYNIVTTITFA